MALETPDSSATEPSSSEPQPPEQLHQIKAHLDLVILALEALTGIGSEAILQAAQDLQLQEVLGDRITLWRWRQANPLRKGKGGRKKLDVDEARAMALISSHLAAQKQTEIRNAIGQLESCSAQNRLPYQAPILGDYLDAFNNLYGDRMNIDQSQIVNSVLEKLALKLLIDLLFYSAPTGSRRLWVALLERSRSHE
ncbi:hypothetical protein Pse7367_3130 [Thalassoporum mexicanum PCC 7367]|uniref:DUF3038 domain-containing protein n=1 Tax=Thalassoporum mexicanum TaxID=3457544 RepID=UPI00029FC0F2|nr:DUF3038 domain-containing protein [Pseudanabaena sp. PCC 7367]AFY71378.1 hypothetical protein Pse7367_3130 [Pseudanabaena sp. PCC 7367]